METEKQRKFLIHFTYLAVLFLIAVIVLKYALPLLAPFVAAFVIAYLLNKPICFLEKKLRLPRKICAIVMVLLFYAVVGVLVTLLGVQALTGAGNLLRNIPNIYEEYIQPFFMGALTNTEDVLMRLDASLVSALNQLGGELISSIGQMVSNLSVKAMSAVSGLASALPGIFIKLVLLIIATFFIAIDYEQLKAFCLRQMNDKTKRLFLEIKKYVGGTLWVCIRAYALIMSITFVEIWIGLTLLKVPFAVLFAAIIAMFDILPVVGTGGIMIPWAVLAAIRGDFVLALGLLALYVVITVVRNIIEPKIVGNQLGLHPIVTLSSMFAGAQLLGVIGVFGFPIGLSLLVYLNRHGVIKILK